MPAKKSRKGKMKGGGKDTDRKGGQESRDLSGSVLGTSESGDLCTELEEKCSVCSRPAPKRCGRCKRQFYCSGEHQKLDWKSHKMNCAVASDTPGSEGIAETNGEDIQQTEGYRIELFDEDFGICMIADRDFGEGELILTEKPAVILPVQGYGVDDKCVPSCFGCFKSIHSQDGGGNMLYRCSRCGIPMCGSTCEKAPQHRDQECKVIREMEGKLRIRGLGSDLKVLQLYLDISVLRVLLYRNNNPKQWEEFLKLETTPRMAFHKLCPIYSTEILTDPKNGFGLHLSRKYAGNNENIVMQASHLLFAHWDILFASDVSPRMRVLFPKLASLTHSCLPNTVYTQTNKDKIAMSLRAGRRIQKGEILTLNYSFDPWSDTLSRREALLQKSIVCICARCRDPTEFGSNCAGVRCYRCSSGLLLPQFPLSPVVVENDQLKPARGKDNFHIDATHSVESRDMITIKEAVLIASLIQEKELCIETRFQEEITNVSPVAESGVKGKLEQENVQENLPYSEHTGASCSVRKVATPEISESEENLDPGPVSKVEDNSKAKIHYQKMDGWKCNNLECNHVFGPTFINKVVEYVETEYKHMKQTCSTVLELGENIKQFLDKYDGMQVLGPYHPAILVAADDFLHAERSRLFYGPTITKDQDRDAVGRITLGLPPFWNEFELERFERKLDYSKRLYTYLDMTKSYDLSIHKGYVIGDFASSTLVLRTWDYKTNAISYLDFHKAVRQSLEKLQEAAKILRVFLTSSQDYRYSSFLEMLITRTLLIVRKNLDVAPNLLLEMLGMSSGDTDDYNFADKIKTKTEGQVQRENSVTRN